MHIVNKTEDQIVNFDNVTNIYQKGNKIAVCYTNGTGSQLAEYDTSKEAHMALKIIAKQMSIGANCYMPHDEKVRSEIEAEETRTSVHHLPNGQKTKGHGGS